MSPWKKRECNRADIYSSDMSLASTKPVSPTDAKPFDRNTNRTTAGKGKVPLEGIRPIEIFSTCQYCHTNCDNVLTYQSVQCGDETRIRRGYSLAVSRHCQLSRTNRD